MADEPRRRATPALLTTGASAVCWLAWTGWDLEYDYDPVTGVGSGPWEPWQVAGSLVCLIILTALTPRWLSSGVSVLAVAGGFTMAWIATAIASSTGPGVSFWPLTAPLVLLAVAAGATIVVIPAAAVWRRAAAGPVTDR